jgi:tRNA(Arg) A34 adenosine deaminase TadA
MLFPDFVLRLPAWISEALSSTPRVFPTTEEKMRLAIRLSRLNVEHGTGGPFGAAIFDVQTQTLIAPGVNLVVPMNCSVLHAEIVAIMMAQQKIQHYDLSVIEGSSFELVTSTEPCSMCFGALPWSGVRSLVCGARDEDARQIGFEEGPKLLNWTLALRERGILVLQDVCRQEAAEVLNQYGRNAGIIYNARSNELTRKAS